MLAWKKVFFDLDNTLYSHEYAFEKAIQDCYTDLVEAWKDHGIQIDLPYVEDWFDVFKYYSDFYWDSYERKEWSQIHYRRQRYISTMKHFKLPCSEDEADHFHTKYYEQANQHVQPFPGMYNLLQYLKSLKIDIGIITNGKTKIQEAKFEKLKLYRYIERKQFFISEEVGVAKPEAEIFRLALGDLPAEQALFIGDTWEHDVVGAMDAGWQAIFLNTQNRPRSTSHQPLVELNHLTQVLPFLERFQKEPMD